MPRSRSRSPKRTERRRSRSRERKHRTKRRSRSRSPAPRFRSRSPVPARRRSRSPHSPPRRRSLSPLSRRRSPPARGRRSSRSRSRSREPSRDDDDVIIIDQPRVDGETPLGGMNDEDREMMALMGFGGFDSTKGKKVQGNEIYVANISRKRRYRQYMNRRGGFNRPLDFIA